MAVPPLSDEATVTLPDTRIGHFEFGAFKLYPHERRLLRNGTPVRLGGRAFDLLHLLIESPGEVLGKRILLSKIWPESIVDEGSLRFHLVAVRKALSDGQGSARYIVNVAGRGYCFVAPVVRHVSQPEQQADAASGGNSRFKVPANANALIGRDDAVAALINRIKTSRFVTIVGPGGIGKTSLAIEVIQRLHVDQGRDAWFFDLSGSSDTETMLSAIAFRLGFNPENGDVVEQLSIGLDRPILLVLDCCEHIVDLVAKFAERLLNTVGHISLLTTSREALRAEGEFVFRLGALGVPPETGEHGAVEALGYPAVRLFVERVNATGVDFEVTDENARLVTRLCRRLDGIALAIELAAGAMQSYGLEGLMNMLDNSLKVMWHGRRTAVPRHQTLNATLDWSYNLLSAAEQQCFRRISVLVGKFPLAAAVSIATSGISSADDLVRCVGELAAKSLLSMDAGGYSLTYEILDTTREYARTKLIESGESRDVLRRHALYWKQAILDGPIEGDHSAQSIIENLRSALTWALEAGEDVLLGYELVAASAAYLIAQKRYQETRKWTEMALSQIDEPGRGSVFELEMRAALAQSLMYTVGNSEAGQAAFTRALEIASALELPERGLLITSGYLVYLHRTGDFNTALEVARKAERSVHSSDRERWAMVMSMLGVALHMTGDVSGSMKAWAVTTSHALESPSADTTAKAGFDHYIRALCGQARNSWLVGKFDDAERIAKETIERAMRLGHPPTACISLIWAGEVSVWMDDWIAVEKNAADLRRIAERHGLLPYLHVEQGLRARVMLANGSVSASIDMMQKAIKGLRDCRYTMPLSPMLISLATALDAAGFAGAALGVCDQAIDAISCNGDRLYLPLANLTKAGFLIKEGPDRLREAEMLLSQVAAMPDFSLSSAIRLESSILTVRLMLTRGCSQGATELLANALRDIEGGICSRMVREANALMEKVRTI